MQKYRATANVLGLQPGDVFESSDPFYEPYAAAGWLEEIADDDGEPLVSPPSLLDGDNQEGPDASSGESSSSSED